MASSSRSESRYAACEQATDFLSTRLSTGSRQRPGALLLFAYTFAGKLWLCLGYDQNGFAENVIESWWSEVLKGVDEFLLS